VYARWPTGDAYIKIVPPDEVRRLIDAHAALLAGGLPVPEIIDTDEQHGVVVMRALTGTPLRDRLLEGRGGVPDGQAVFDVVQRFAAINPEGAWLADGEQVSLIDAAPRHAAMLAKVLPPLTGRLDALLAALHEPGVTTETRVVHGDLHDGQLQVDDRGRIVGVLDVDRVGLGEPLDDLARFVGHAIALGELTSEARAHIDGFTSRLRHHLDGLVDRREFDRRVAAALIGLATGPFRSQMPFWNERVGDVLRLAEGFMPDENTLSEPS
jgi:aminoglycoside phosphotransferase (APT) family kinase protein